MASVDSGVETGNDSNDSSIVQHENPRAKNSTTIILPDCDHTIARNKVAVNEVASDACVSKESFLPSPSYLMSLGPNWPDDVSLCSVMDHCNFGDSRKTPLADHDLEQKWQKNQMLRKYKENMSMIHCDRTYRRRITELKLRSAKEYSRLTLEDYDRLSAHERAAIRDLKIRSEWIEWKRPLNERKMRLAAASNNISIVRELLRNDVSPNNHDVEGRTPLHHAACRGYTEMVYLLLEHGADPNQRDRIGNTPLHLAAVTSKISVVTLLLAAGTDVCSIDQHGFNPLHLAQAKLKMLQNCKYGSTVNIKDEMHAIVRMLMAYLNKQKNMNEQIETLNNFCSRLSLSNTTDQVQDDVKDLLANIETLDITS